MCPHSISHSTLRIDEVVPSCMSLVLAERNPNAQLMYGS
jgi:hypothetical protein